MQNMSNGKLAPEQKQFVEDMASLLMAWGQAATASRVYGYLLLQNEPVSLDDITRDLEISKSNAWGAAKALEEQMDIRRLGERGSKRALYVIGDDPGGALRNKIALLGMMGDLLSNRKDQVAKGPAAARMADLAAFHHRLSAAIEAVVAPPRRSDAA